MAIIYLLITGEPWLCYNQD